MKKLKSLPSLQRKLWKLCSEYIRRKDADEMEYVRCFTCGKSDHWKRLQCGHYIPSSVSLYLRYDEMNLKPQCVRCNMWLSSNATQYAIGLEKLYGPGILQKLEEEKHKITKFTRQDYEDKIAYYKAKLEALCG